MEQFWSKAYRIAEGTTAFWHLGPLKLWIRRMPGEWQIAYLPGEDDCDESTWILAASQEMPPDLVYRRFAFDSSGEDDCVILKPGLPDRPIVSRPQVSLEIPEGGSADVVCGVPLCVEIFAGILEKPVRLTTIPIRELSRTWFGSPLEGEPCYASVTRAVRDHQVLEPYGFRVLCPVSVTNQTSETLPIERICIRVAHLAIYEGEEYLWSNRMKVSKTSIHIASRVTFGSKAPRLEPEAVLVAEPRVKADQGGILSQTFNHLKTFLGDQQ